MAAWRTFLRRCGSVTLAMCLLVTAAGYLYITGLDNDVQQGRALRSWALFGLVAAVPSVVLSCFEQGRKRLVRLTLASLLFLLWHFARTEF